MFQRLFRQADELIDARFRRDGRDWLYQPWDDGPSYRMAHGQYLDTRAAQRRFTRIYTVILLGAVLAMTGFLCWAFALGGPSPAPGNAGLPRPGDGRLPGTNRLVHN